MSPPRQDIKMDKEEYYRQLYSLNESSDDEVDTNDAREVLRQSKPALAASFPASSASRSSQRRSQQLATTTRKAPAIHRTTSAPVTSANEVKETPLLRRKSSLLRHDISFQDKSTPPSGGTSPTDNTSISTSKLVPERSNSTPNIGSVVMKNSKGVAAMLGKRSGETLDKATKKKKGTKGSEEDVIEMVPEAKRYLKGQTIFWIPPNDIEVRRKKRINAARKYGATWTKSWTADVTHVVVDDDQDYRKVMAVLGPKMDSDEMPPHIKLVRQGYISDCIGDHRLIDPEQSRYFVKGHRGTTANEEVSLSGSQISDKSLQLKAAKPRKGDFGPENTPSQSQPSLQEHMHEEPADTTSRVSFLSEYHKETEISETARQLSPLETGMGELGDSLDEFIVQAREYSDLPLDLDEGVDAHENPPSSQDDPEESGGEAEERARQKNPKKKKQTKVKLGDLSTFVCMRGGTGRMRENDPNKRTIEILTAMGEYYDRIKVPWKPNAYRLAVKTIKELPDKLEYYEDAIRLPRIGDRIARKIEEISITGRLRRLDNALADPHHKALELFLKIYGVGLVQAEEWIAAKYTTLEEVAKLPLTKNQRIGLEHYHDFDTRIPREEVTALGEIVIKAAKSIDNQVEAIIGGSYRRGAATSGDIDFIITKRGTTSSGDLLSFLRKLVGHLERTGFLVHALAVPGHRDDSGSKWHGACVLPGNPIWRRIDLLVVPETEFGAALIYFTGDQIFNRSIRLKAGKMGMRLNQKGLYKDVMRGYGREKMNEGTLVEGADERKIFDLLGVPWRPPHERICS